MLVVMFVAAIRRPVHFCPERTRYNNGALRPIKMGAMASLRRYEAALAGLRYIDHAFVPVLG